jgi:hypothetical protein
MGSHYDRILTFFLEEAALLKGVKKELSPY